ncbi:FecR family protein [Arcticibacter tournemirensis]|nr:FecR domain-containing protein [Arcticibacter tournemirensis]
MEQKISKALLERFLKNQCTRQELELVLNWLEKPGADEVLHEIMTETWKEDIESATEESGSDLQMLQWKQRIRKLTKNDAGKRRHLHTKTTKKSKSFLLRYAAVWVAVMIGIGAFWVFNSKKRGPLLVSMVEKHNPYGQRSQFMLPDSSVVYLGAGSSLRFPEKFQGSTREISLQGEAFFEIAHNPVKPFVVRSADIVTRVLGTSFKIEAHEGGPVNVSVATGKVSVGHIDNTTSPIRTLAVLTTGQSISWDKSSQKAIAGSFPVDDLEQWRQGKLVFSHSSLANMARDLERWYKVEIRIKDPGKAKEKVSGVIPSTISVKDAMNVLSITGHFKYTIQDSIINIY